MIRTVSIGYILAQGILVSIDGALATIRIGNKTVTGKLIGA